MPARIVYEDERCVAFEDINPQAPVHILIVPREHIPTLNDIKDEHKELIGHLSTVATKIAAEREIQDRGYRVVINCNPQGGQMVYHLHIHVLGGRQMTWPPG